MMLEPIAERLELQGLGVQGHDIFINFMPAEATGLLLRYPVGGMGIDHDLPGYRKGSFQLIARGKEFEETKTLINQAVLALEMAEADLTGMRVKYMRPRHDPFTFPPSVGNNIEFVVNVDCAYVIL
jgi:hypothetical protein